MTDGLMAFVIPFLIVLVAEMGDKTQLITIGLSTKYGAIKVITGIFISIVVLNIMAGLVGNMLSRLDYLQTAIQVGATISFIVFGLWTLKGDTNSEVKVSRKAMRNPIFSISAMFFVAELGDKTQLSILALSTSFPRYPYMVFIGATLGMIIADSIGIIIGAAMGKRLPERKIRVFSAVIFITFGFFSAYQVMIDKMKFGTSYVIGILIMAFVVIAFIYTKFLRSEDIT